MRAELVDFLRLRGATDEEIGRADREGWLPLLVYDRVLVPYPARYEADEMAARAGAGPETVRLLWRALGFPDVPAGLPIFTDFDLEALALTAPVLDSSALDDFLRQVRVIASSLARMAAIEADAMADALEEWRDQIDGEERVADFVAQTFDWDIVARLVDYTHRVQLRAALWRRMARDTMGEGIDLGVAFADLAGYTELSEVLDEADLDRLLTRFEELAFDSVAAHGARVVKTIGDEVMITGEIAGVAGAVLDLTAAAGADPILPPVRSGVASGPALSRYGDLYGPVVNLAHRAAERARPGTVLASESVQRALVDDPTFRWRDLGPRRLRGIGETPLWVLRRAAGQ